MYSQAKYLCWKLSFGHKHVHMQKHQKRRAWKHIQTRHSLCTSGSMNMGKSNEIALATKKTSVFTHFVIISRILYSVYLKICFHWLSLNLKLKSVHIFQSWSIKNQGLSRTKNQFQVLSRPWNQTAEIQGFSRCVRTLKTLRGRGTSKAKVLKEKFNVTLEFLEEQTSNSKTFHGRDMDFGEITQAQMYTLIHSNWTNVLSLHICSLLYATDVKLWALDFINILNSDIYRQVTPRTGKSL